MAYSTRSLEQLFTYAAKKASAALRTESAAHNRNCLSVLFDTDLDAFLFDDVVGTVLIPANLTKIVGNGLFAIAAETKR